MKLICTISLMLILLIFIAIGLYISAGLLFGEKVSPMLYMIDIVLIILAILIATLIPLK